MHTKEGALYVVTLGRYLDTDQPLSRVDALKLWRMARADSVQFSAAAKDELTFMEDDL